MDNRKSQLLIINDTKIYYLVTRILDMILSFVALVCLMPVLIFIGIVIKVDDSKGGVIFSQNRIGKDGRQFRMYKFRSMYSDAEKRLSEVIHLNEADEVIFKVKNDPRITKVGVFLRKSSLDELPQLYNVLIGDMSLVGPRPALPREVDRYSSYDKQRLKVLPGITGLWQVSGRSSLTFNEMIKLDIDFIENRSVYNYIKILIRTIFVVIKFENAY